MKPHEENDHRATRFISLAAATVIALASGSNYVYSAYSPQLADKLGLSATETNLVGLMGNFGMYITGIPMGILVDSRGPRIPIFCGSFLLLAGYFPVYYAFEHGEGSMPVWGLCVAEFVTGLGGCAAFAAAVKACALLFPNHRGAATSLPLSAFGLSAFFFSTLSSALFPGNTGGFLLLLAIATFAMVFVSFFFVRVLPASTSYTTLPNSDPDDPDKHNRLHRARSSSLSRTGSTATASLEPNSDNTASETSSLFSKSSHSSDEEENQRDIESSPQLASHDPGTHVDIRGLALCRNTDFWLLFSVFGMLAGCGLMTINNIGHDVQALWRAYDSSVTPKFMQHQQGLHVSIISVMSFTGRIFSGFTSDFLWKKYQLQRFWLMVLAAFIFALGQFSGTVVSDPHFLWLISGFVGFAYGCMFALCPPVISEWFGVHGLSQNFGCLTLAAVVSGNLFNLVYGRIYDAHSVREGKEMTCHEGVACYRGAYIMTLCSSLTALGVSLIALRRHRAAAAKKALIC